LKKLAFNLIFTAIVVVVYFVFLNLSGIFGGISGIIVKTLGTNLLLFLSAIILIYAMKLKIPYFYNSRSLNKSLMLAIILSFAAVLLILLSKDGAGNSSVKMLELLSFIVLVPIAEEIFFRGYMLSFTRETAHKLFSIVFVSLFFGFLHTGQGTVIPMVLLSFLLCAIYLFSKSIIWAILFHLIWNSAFLLRETGQIYTLKMVGLIFFCQLILFFTVVYRLKKNEY